MPCPAGERIIVPDVPVAGPDLHDRLRLIGGKGQLQQLLRTPLAIGDRLAPDHPPHAIQDMRRKRRGALVRDGLQQEVQQRLIAVCAHPHHLPSENTPIDP